MVSLLLIPDRSLNWNFWADLWTVYGFSDKGKTPLFTIPDFYASGFLNEFLEKGNRAECKIVQMNNKAPSYQKLIVNITGKLSEDFQLFRSEIYQPLKSVVLR